MFSSTEREAVRERLLAFAEEDQHICAAAHTGSYASGELDKWSDIDIALGVVDEDIQATLERWTHLLSDRFHVVHYWDLAVGKTVYRVFLLPGWLEVDIAFSPAAEFGARGPNWRMVFGQAASLESPPTVDATNKLVGLCWHHVLHTAACLERGQTWRAEWFISEARHHVLELACYRFGLSVEYGRGFDQLPAEVTDPVAATLVPRLNETDLREALSRLAAAFLTEVAALDSALATRLAGMLDELARG